MKTAVVTGASTGIGRESAKLLAKQGFTVFMVSRDPGRAAAALEQVKAAAPGATVHGLTADLSLMSEARRIASELKSKTSRLDVLINNAATIPTALVKTSEGLESSFATNVMTPFILVDELKDLLRASAPARVINFVGGNEKTVDLSDLQSEKVKFDGFKTYGRSKICVGLLTIEQARRFADSKVTVNGVLPGVVNTEGMRAIPGFMGFLMLLMRPFMKTSESGADTPVWAATAPELEGVSGKFYGSPFGPGRVELKELPPAAKDIEAAKRLYESCEKIANARAPAPSPVSRASTG